MLLEMAGVFVHLFRTNPQRHYSTAVVPRDVIVSLRNRGCGVTSLRHFLYLPPPLNTHTPDNTILVIFICHCYSTLRRQTDNNSKKLSWHSQARGNLLLSGIFLRSWTTVLENVKTRMSLNLPVLNSLTNKTVVNCSTPISTNISNPNKRRRINFDEIPEEEEELNISY